jgi:hypothetical protein
MRAMALLCVCGCGFSEVTPRDGFSDGLVAGDLSHCEFFDDCPAGYNCVGNQCAAATGSCAAQKSLTPVSAVYWIASGAGAYRAYCDMSGGGNELCTDSEAAHQSQVHDGSALVFSMMSELDVAVGFCTVWNVKSVGDGFPLDRVLDASGRPAGDTCARLGFISDGAIAGCAYGATSTCGYTVAAANRWGTFCSGCAMNGGYYSQYTLQGPFTNGTVLADAAGTMRARCNVR